MAAAGKKYKCIQDIIKMTLVRSIYNKSTSLYLMDIMVKYKK